MYDEDDVYMGGGFMESHETARVALGVTCALIFALLFFIAVVMVTLQC